jgi:hypothetical protein
MHGQQNIKISTSVQLDHLHTLETTITETSQNMKHRHILENYSGDKQKITGSPQPFFLYPMVSPKKSPSAIFDRFTHSAKNEAEPTNWDDRWKVYVPEKQISIHWGQHILKIYMPNKPNRHNSTSPRVGTYVIRRGTLGSNGQLKNLVLALVGVQ